MCEIAPFQMECDNEEYQDKLTCCLICKLKYALRNFLQSIPIVGKFIDNYHCPNFEPKQEVKDE